MPKIEDVYTEDEFMSAVESDTKELEQLAAADAIKHISRAGEKLAEEVAVDAFDLLGEAVEVGPRPTYGGGEGRNPRFDDLSKTVERKQKSPPRLRNHRRNQNRRMAVKVRHQARQSKSSFGRR